MRAPRNIVLRTWYGAEAAVDIRDRAWHRAGFRGFLLLHPPLFNWLLRRGLPFVVYRKLGVLHEFGHLQAAPAVLVYLLAGLWSLQRLGMLNPLNGALFLLGSHLLWELAAETYVRWRTGAYYPQAYRNVSLWPRRLFFSGNAFLFVGSWAAVIWRG